MRQDENMPILLKTQVESADKTPVTVCRARVGGLCGFQDTVERVPAGSPKPALRRRAGALAENAHIGKNGSGESCLRQAREYAETGKIEGFWTPRRESRTKPRGRARPAAVTSARGAGSFGDLRGRSKHSEKQPEGVAE